MSNACEHIDRETRHYTISYGAWKEVEEAIGFVGPTDRAEPVEMALGAEAACLCNSIALNAHRHGIKLEGLEVNVHADVDPSVLFEVKGDVTDEQLQTIRELVHYSPVHGMVEYANTVEAKVARA